MGLQTIIIRREVVINLGDYQNERVGVEVTYTPEPGETPAQAHQSASALTDVMLRNEIEPVLEGIPAFRRESIMKTFGVGQPATE